MAAFPRPFKEDHPRPFKKIILVLSGKITLVLSRKIILVLSRKIILVLSGKIILVLSRKIIERFLSSPLLQAFDSVMCLALRPQVVSQAPQYVQIFRDASRLWWLLMTLTFLNSATL